MMVWYVLRPYYWQLDRRVRSANRFAVGAVLLLLGFGGQFVWDNLIRDNLPLLRSETAVTMFAPILANVLILFIFFGVVGIADVLRLLYHAADLDLLLAAPLPLRTIFAAKLVQCSRVTLLPAIVLGLMFAIFGAAREAEAAFYGVTLLFLMAGMVLVTAVIFCVVLALARLIPARLVNVWLPIIASLLMLVMVWGQQKLIDWLLRQEAVLRWLAEALQNTAQLTQFTLALIGGAILATGAAYLVFTTAYYDGWNQLREVQTRPKRETAGKMGWWYRPFPPEVRPFVRNEWLLLRREPSRLVNLALIPLLVLFMFSPLLGSQRVETLRPLIFWMLLAIGLFINFTSLSGEIVPAAGRDGAQSELWRVAPVSARAVLAGKFWGNAWPLVLLLWVLFLALVGWYFGFASWQVVLLVTAVSWQISMSAAILLPLGALLADFQAADPAKSMTVPGSLLVLIVHSLFALLTLLSVAWLLLHWFPGGDLIRPLQNLSDFAMVGWLFSDSALPALVLGGSQLLFGLSIVPLWRAAARRLENWERV